MYIEFNGEIDKSNYHQIIKSQNVASRIALFLPWVFETGFLLIFWIGSKIYWFGIFWGLLTAFTVVMLIFPNSVISNKYYDIIAHLPTRVTIDDEALRRYGNGEENYAGREVIDVKKVIDRGNFYEIIFYFPHKDCFFICQKNLIVEGTIEEFEELFADRLVRKIRKTK